MLSDDAKVGSPPSEFGVSRLAGYQTREFLVVELEPVVYHMVELEPVRIRKSQVRSVIVGIGQDSRIMVSGLKRKLC